MKSPAEIIREQLGRYLVEGVRYHSELPAELAAWYVYTSDGGHSIVAVLAATMSGAADLTRLLVPVPVRSVLRGYELRDGYVVVDLPYDPALGLLTPAEDDEYEEEGEPPAPEVTA